MAKPSNLVMGNELCHDAIVMFYVTLEQELLKPK